MDDIRWFECEAGEEGYCLKIEKNYDEPFDGYILRKWYLSPGDMEDINPIGDNKSYVAFTLYWLEDNEGNAVSISENDRNDLAKYVKNLETSESANIEGIQYTNGKLLPFSNDMRIRSRYLTDNEIEKYCKRIFDEEKDNMYEARVSVFADEFIDIDKPADKDFLA